MRTKISTILTAVFLANIAFIHSPLQAQISSPAAPDSASVFSDHFASGKVCAMCHSTASSATALKDNKNRAIGPHNLWRTTMMAHATVDPLWRAVMAAEVAATPVRKAEIETKCLRCHAPMASMQAQKNGVAPSAESFLHDTSTLASLASDGVSCTACHQMSPDKLGSDERFSGHFHIGNELKIYGPHERPFLMPMYRHTGFTATEGKHIRESELCASCHTLFTDSLEQDGTGTGHSLLEQGPYVEWQNSQYNDENDSGEFAASCQDCHVPIVDEDGEEIRTRIARNPGGRNFPPTRARSPFGRHVFVGGNTLIPSIIQAQLETAGADDEVISQFDKAIKSTRKLLRNDTARISIAETKQIGDRLEVSVAVKNLTGHKLPTAYPSRRVWIRLQVLDADGKVAFSSGQFDDRGRIIDAQERLLPSEEVSGPIQPHFSSISSADQVQIYESVMEDAHSATTYFLLRGAKYRKDNRLLPLGWSSEHPRGPLTAPVGTDGDPDFLAGTDVVRYVVAGVPGNSPLRIEASLYYQVLGSRYAAQLLTQDVPEMNTFAELYGAADARPELLARAEKTLSRQ